MELWIRSQNRTTLKQVKEICFNDFDCLLDDECNCLGTYETKERALEVLDEIQSKLKPLLYLKPKALLKPQDLEYAKKFYEELNEREFITCDRHFEIIPFSSNVVVYEMPKE